MKAVRKVEKIKNKTERRKKEEKEESERERERERERESELFKSPVYLEAGVNFDVDISNQTYFRVVNRFKT